MNTTDNTDNLTALDAYRWIVEQCVEPQFHMIVHGLITQQLIHSVMCQQSAGITHTRTVQTVHEQCVDRGLERVTGHNVMCLSNHIPLTDHKLVLAD